MTLAPTTELIAAAVARGGAVPAFNVISLEHAEAIARGADESGVDTILQVSQNAIGFHGGQLRPLVAACREVALAADSRIAVHLDHLDDLGLALDALAASAELGVGSLMIDASRLPFAENVARTADIARRGAALNVWIEAELGEIGGKDGAHAPGVRTDPADAAAFVASTGVDGLAVAVGTSHAMRDRSAAIDIDLVARLAAAVPVPLVLHGSSGVPDAVIRDAVAAGIRKVNVGTALNIAGTRALRAALAADLAGIDPRPFTSVSRDAMTRTVASFATLLA